MAVKKETTLVKKARVVLLKTVGGKWWKQHTSEFTNRGFPDLMGVVKGQHIALEAKIGDNELTTLQEYHLAQFKKNGSITGEFSTVKEAVKIVTKGLKKRGILWQ